MSEYPDSTFAHAGLDVADMDAVVEWYVANLGLTVARKAEGVMTFLADPTGRVIVEFYANPSAAVMDFPESHPLTFHLAFLVEDPDATAERLLAAGATVAEASKTTAAGDRMVMLRDPFGIRIQFIRRAVPMF